MFMERDRKTDLRIVKTREAIQAAFERLLETAEFSEITVSAIARAARVSRKTFYAHYTSTSDLLADMAQKAVDDIAIEIQPEGELRNVDDWIEQFVRTTLTTMRDHPHFSANVVRSMPAGAFLKVFAKPLERLCEQELAKRELALTAGHEYVLSFFIGGFCATYETWASLGCGVEELDKAADLIARAATQGVGQLLEPNPSLS